MIKENINNNKGKGSVPFLFNIYSAGATYIKLLENL